MSSANMYFLAGHPVNFYLFTDNPEKIAHIQMAPENHLFVIPVQNDPRWQDISRSRMDIINCYIQSQFQHEVDYLYSVDINVQLLAHIGVEIIDALVATISSWQVTPQHQNKGSEAHPESQSAIPEGQGDFYYTASFYGGSVSEVYKLTRACSAGLREDTENGTEAPWHPESHINSPTKMRSGFPDLKTEQEDNIMLKQCLSKDWAGKVTEKGPDKRNLCDLKSFQIKIGVKAQLKHSGELS
ncbi:hypothetical protein DV515_00015230 [Chloebia gouldiae]|uniref:Uncharacterized protein n=1 Tax=Chloebia gouldiae TaxID=44316 RepID=A0A3L8RWA8_CHLGU|nr:hypothetical protein DV515_00015230 [Chloebia gouldiae]